MLFYGDNYLFQHENLDMKTSHGNDIRCMVQWELAPGIMKPAKFETADEHLVHRRAIL